MSIITKFTTYRKFGFTSSQVINWLRYSISRKRKILSYRPLWLLIYASDLCNLKCNMCPHHTSGNATKFEYLKKEGGIMKPEAFRAVMDLFPEATLVMFAGVGEPLLNPYFFELAEMAVKNKKIINLVTNGTFLDKENINRIIKLKRFNQISISLNAATAQDYSSICNMPNETFDKVVSNIKNLVYSKRQYKGEAKFEIIVSAVCSQEFVPKVKNFLLFADKLGVDRIDVHNCIDFSIINKEYKFTPLTTSNKNIETVLDLENFSQEKIRAAVNLPRILEKKDFSRKCEWFFKNLCIDAHGNIGSCGRVMNPDLGNGNLFIDKGDVWNNEYMKEMRAKFINKSSWLPTCCNNCIENYKLML